MLRPIYLQITHSPLFPAHWAVYVPYASSLSACPLPPLSQTKGKLLNATGDPSTGFIHEIRRFYKPGGGETSLLIGQVDELHVADDTGGGGREVLEEGQERITPKDKLEKLALEVEAPGKSLVGYTDVLGPVCRFHIVIGPQAYIQLMGFCLVVIRE
jgi:hypothetical protein